MRTEGEVGMKEHKVPVQSLIDHIKTAEDVDPWAKEMAEELLKEQAPKQIVRKQGKRENSDGSIDYFAEWYCPHCGKLLNRGFDMPWIEYCYKCGKPVLWKER